MDGFPRNTTQAALILLLHSRMKSLRDQHGPPYRTPQFRVAVLWVPEAISIERQLLRGSEARKENEVRKKYGMPVIA